MPKYIRYNGLLYVEADKSRYQQLLEEDPEKAEAYRLKMRERINKRQRELYKKRVKTPEQIKEEQRLAPSKSVIEQRIEERKKKRRWPTEEFPDFETWKKEKEEREKKSALLYQGNLYLPVG